MVTHPPRWLFVLFPATAMLLGWGLRGYIGGGPYGAMMPGCFVALSLALLLGYPMKTAAMAALFGAVGVGYGGTMTYGQTLGFLRADDTVYWGLLGCLVKGSAWGLLGGVVLGLGLSRNHYRRKTLAVAFLISVVAFYVGVSLINSPRLLYFSDPVNKPRDESWAGILFAAAALLAFLRTQGSKQALLLPLRFGLWGALGGGVGFAGGAVWMVIGPKLPIPPKIIGWWKVMEFFFGFSFGAALGNCAYLNRNELHLAGQTGDTPNPSWGPCMGYIAYVAALFGGYMVLSQLELGNAFSQFAIQVAFGYILFGAITIIIGLHSLQGAWHGAITMAFFHTVLDYTRDLNDTKHFGFTAPGFVQLIIILVSCLLVGYLVQRAYQGANPVVNLFLLAIWACYLSSCARSFIHYEMFFPPDGQGRIAHLLSTKPSIVFVHGTFTLSALICSWIAWTHFRTEEANRPSASL